MSEPVKKVILRSPTAELVYIDAAIARAAMFESTPIYDSVVADLRTDHRKPRRWFRRSR